MVKATLSFEMPKFFAVSVLRFMLLVILLHALVATLLNSPTLALPFLGSTVADSSDSVLIFSPRLGEQLSSPHCFIPHRELAHVRVGLAFSGGGARSLVQIGVLQALEENNIPIDFIVGTSMGSMIGGLYAAGYSAQQLGEIMKSIDWGSILTDSPPRQNLLVSQKLDRDPFLLQLRFRGLTPQVPRALTGGQKLLSILTELTWRANYWGTTSFDNLRIPFRAVATDLYTGREVLLDSGDLSEAMQASSALPLLLAPVPRQGMLLIDGGVKDNIPVAAVREQGIDVVLAVDATSNLQPADPFALPWQIADQVTTIMQQERNEQQKRLADVLISFKDLARSSLDFSNLDSLIALGYRRTMEKMPALRRWCALSARLPAAPQELRVRHVDFKGIKIDLAHFQLFAGNGSPHAESLSALEIQEAVDALYASGNYDKVQAWVCGDTLRFVLRENPVLRHFAFRGNAIYPDSVLRGCMQSRLGEIINHNQGREDLRALIEHYRRGGYALAEIQSVKFDSLSGEVRIAIDEGRIAAVDIEGLQHTRPFVVQREFSVKPGEIFNSKAAGRGLDNIHSTGLFEKVSLTPVERDSNGTRLRIQLEEKPSGILRVGGYYESERGTYGSLEIGNENMLGTASKLHLHGTAGSRGFLTKATWHTDRLFSTFLTLSASAYLQSWDNYVYPAAAADPTGQYQDRRKGVKWTLGQQVRRLGALSAELRWEDIQLRAISGTGYPTGESNFLFFTGKSIIDTRDQLPFPRTGRYANIFYEYAQPSQPDADSFVKFFAQLESFHAFGPHVLHPKFIGGIADQTTPFSEQFRLSGPTPVFGLRDRELIGRNLVVASMEYRYQLRRRPLFDMYLSVRYDLNGIWQDRTDATAHEFRHALGLAVTVDTPVLPIGIALGWLEHWQKRLYFNVGVPF